MALVFLTVFCRASFGADSAPDADFEAANRLYEQGKYTEAEAGYGKLIKHGTISEALYFNRGNALLKMNHLGQAIASYREAQRLAPRDGQVRANLRVARLRARGGAAVSLNRWSGWWDRLSLNEWTCLTAVSFWLLFLFLTLALWRKPLKDKLKKGVWSSAVALLIFGLGLGLSLHGQLAPSAIVIAGEADVRNGPLDEAQSLFKVRDGAELAVDDAKDGWFQVTDSAQRTGWIRDSQVILLGRVDPIK